MMQFESIRNKAISKTVQRYSHNLKITEQKPEQRQITEHCKKSINGLSKTLKSNFRIFLKRLSVKGVLID